MTEPQDITARLVRRCIEGDDAAQAEFYTRFAPLVRRAVLRKLGVVHANPTAFSEVDDISNEIFSRLFANQCASLQRLKNPDSIQAWLMTIAQNHTISYLRRVANRPSGASWELHEEAAAYVAEPPDAPVVQEERAARIADALSTLSAQDRLVLDLFYMQGLEYSEIGEIMGMNINTVAARLRRAKAKLRRALEKDADDLV